MRAYNLGFISDTDLFNHVKTTINRYRKSIDLKQFNQSLIDPIKLSFDTLVYGMSIEETINAECVRQIDKSNTNLIGYFHQDLFKWIGNGWTVPETGFDIVNEERHIFVELKNKHNTMNSSSASATYMKMQNKILQDDQATCMLVEVISGSSKDEVWNQSGFSHNKIRKVSIDKFYNIAFNDPFAFVKLCRVLPSVIEDVISTQGNSSINNSVFDELQAMNPNLLKSLYLLAFNRYDGFDQF